jgi:hypothetical protein
MRVVLEIKEGGKVASARRWLLGNAITGNWCGRPRGSLEHFGRAELDLGEIRIA